MESKRINEFLDANSTMLYQAFDFTKFIVNGNILLPTVQITKSIVDQENVQSMRAVLASYTLKQTSKVVLTPPTWRDYLVRLYPKPAEVSEVLTPRNSIEKEAFDHEFKKGWSVGVRQAERVFDADYTRLENDIVGHYDFRTLASQGVLSLPPTSQSLYPTYLTEDGIYLTYLALPYRQLRNDLTGQMGPHTGSLPHRQLRKLLPCSKGCTLSKNDD